MALVEMNFESQYLHGNTQINVILPDKPRGVDPRVFYGEQKKYKVLWLLHGSFGDHTDWVRKSNIELYACENDLIVVMPNALNTSYTDWNTFADGYGVCNFFFQELMPLIFGWFPASSQKEDNYVAGLSMGGNGALKFALIHPECFAKAAILSASPYRYETDLSEMTGSKLKKFQNTLANGGGLENFLCSDDNTWRLAKEMDPATLPPMYFGIGGDDPGIERFNRFRKLLEERKINAEFEVIPGYAHEWRVWEITIQHALTFFGFSSREGGNQY